MKYTQQEFVQKIKTQYPQYSEMDDTELFDRMIAKYPQYKKAIVTDDDGAGVDFVQGVAKSVGQTVLGAGTLGRKFQTGMSKAGDAVFGEKNPFKTGGASVFDTGSESNTKAQELVKADTKGEKIGKFAGDVAQFAIPGSYASKATAGASLATRMAAQGAVGAGVQAAKTGDIGKDELIIGGISALTVPAGDILVKGLSSLSKTLPQWLVKPLLKQAPNAKLKGKDAAKYLVESGRVGSVEKLIQQSDDAMKILDTQIDDLISQGTGRGVTISRDKLLGDLVKNINAAGGATDEKQILQIADSLAPQARGLLSKPTLTLEDAAKLRKLLDRTLGDRAFLAKELPFNKEVLMEFTNSLRETVKSSLDDANPIVAAQFKNHFGTAEQILKSMPEEQLAKNGGIDALIGRTKTNLVDGLNAEGADDVAKLIAKIPTKGIESLDDFKELALNASNPIRPLYSELSKNITMKNALLARMTAGGGANSVGMYDLLTGGAAFTATGNPVAALLATGGRRAFESAPVKTALAQVFKNTDKVIPILMKMEPGARAAVLQLISELSENTQGDQQKPKTK